MTEKNDVVTITQYELDVLRQKAFLAESYLSMTLCVDCRKLKNQYFCCAHCGSSKG